MLKNRKNVLKNSNSRNSDEQIVQEKIQSKRNSAQTTRSSTQSSFGSGPVFQVVNRELRERFYHGKSETKTFSQALEQRKKKLPKSRFKLPMQIRKDLQKAFNVFNLDGTGVLKIDNLRIALRCLGFEPNHEDLNFLFALVGTKDADGLSFTEFEYVMARTMTVKDTEDELRKSFKLFSEYTKGNVTFEKLKEVNDMLGESLNNEELKEMISAIDKDKNGIVSEEEFLEFCSDTVLWNCK